MCNALPLRERCHEKQQRKQRKQYFHDKAVAAAIERSRQQKEES